MVNDGVASMRRSVCSATVDAAVRRAQLPVGSADRAHLLSSASFQSAWGTSVHIDERRTSSSDHERVADPFNPFNEYPLTAQPMDTRSPETKVTTETSAALHPRVTILTLGASCEAQQDRLIVVAPVYNEAGGIGAFIRRVVDLSRTTGVAGLLLVDDGSTDQSVAVIEEHARACPFPVRLVRLSRNFGHQNACVAGLAMAERWTDEISAGWIGLIDSDLQDDPLDFVQLLKQSREAHVVYAQRTIRNDGLIMRIFAPVFYWMLSTAAKLSVPRNAGTFSIMRPAAVRSIVQIADNDPYVPGLRAWIGGRQVGVSIERAARAGGRSHVGYLGLLSLSLRAFILYSNFLLNWMIIVGGVTLVLSFVAAVVLGTMRVAGLIDIPGVTTIVILQLLFFSITLVALGLLGHMIGRTKANTSRQPTWIIAEHRTIQ